MAMKPSHSIAKPPRRAGRWHWWAPRLACLPIASVVLLWSWHGTEFSIGGLASGAPAITRFVTDMMPPDTTVEILAIGWESAMLTLQIALLGTAIGGLIALLLGLLAANNLTPEWVHHPLKILLAVMRSVPVLLLALLFVQTLPQRLLGAAPFVNEIAFLSKPTLLGVRWEPVVLCC